MDEWTSNPQFEKNVRESFGVPQIRSEFVDQVYADLMQRAAAKPPKHRPYFELRPAWIATFMILSLIIIATLAIGPQNVYASVLKLLGYIPGVGIVDQSSPIRVLAEPVTVIREGVTVSVTQAVLSADKTVIFVKIDDVPADAYPEGEAGGCFGKVDLKLSNGTLLEGGFISGGNWLSFESRLEYGAVPAQVNDAVLLAACIGGTMPGALPENWEIPLRFVPAPPDMTVAPVIELSTPVMTNIPGVGVTSTPVLSNTMTLNGITLTLEKFVEMEGGYQLYGSLNFENLPLSQGFSNTIGPLKMTDANGNRTPFEETFSEPQENTVYDPNKFSWIYRTNQKAFAAPLVISLPSVEMWITPQIPFELDLGPNPQIGQTWEINRDLNFAGHTVRLLSTQLVESPSPEWASALVFTYESNEYGIYIEMQVLDDIPQTPLIEILGGGGGGGGPLTGKQLAWMLYGEIPNGLRRFTVSANVPYRINGPWQIVWNPPSTSDPIPTPAPEACLTSEKWEQLKGQHEALPAGLGGKILFTTDAMPPDINVFIASLDGSDLRGLVNGYYPMLSPDGTRIAYMTQNVGLNILNLNNGQTIALGSGTNPVWSTDGSRILFQNPSDGLYVINADGSGLKKIQTGSPRVQPVGWLPDNQTIVFGAQVGDTYNLYEHVFKTYNLQTGETKSLFPITIKTATGSLSPDGQWIAFNARQFGANLDGAVFISRLDGSERKLVTRLDNTLAFHPIWSPSGQWLIVNVIEPYKPVSPVLVNPFTCQVISLPGLNGEIRGWVNP